MGTRADHHQPPRLTRWLLVGLGIWLLIIPTGCYGRFRLTKALYRFNGSVTNETAIQSVVFWLMLIFPVYEIGLIVDAVVLNFLDFIDETNNGTAAIQPAGSHHQDVEWLSVDPHQARLRTAAGQEVRFHKVSDTLVEVRDPRGRLAGRVVKTTQAQWLLQDATGTTVKVIAARDAAAAQL